MATRNFAPEFIAQLAKLAVARVENHKDSDYRKMIDENLKYLIKIRTAKAKRGIFNWFPTPYTEPTEEDAVKQSRKMVDLYYSDMTAFEYRWENKVKFTSELLNLSQQRAEVGEFVSISSEDWNTLMTWITDEERAKCGVVMD